MTLCEDGLLETAMKADSVAVEVAHHAFAVALNENEKMYPGIG